MYLQTKDKIECCGCTACVTICPKNCLTMEKDEYGFFFPQMTDSNSCIHCKRCESVCPFGRNKTIKPEEVYEKPICFSGWHKDSSTRAASTSGAAFVGIVQACEKNGYHRFYGVKYDDSLMAVHAGVNSTDELSCLIATKYVQSDIGDAYRDIIDDLSEGKRVVFSGTPCQVEGLQNVIPTKLREDLITIALVCHGAASPAAYRKYLDQTGKKNSSEPVAIKFRDKREKDGELSHRFTTVTLANGSVLADTENLYTLAFGLGLIHRESCSRCPYTTPYRSCDFTIGDFWGIEDFKPELRKEISKGISLIYAHSERAKALLPDVKVVMDIQEEPLEHSLHIRQQQLRIPFAKNPRRDGFLRKVVIENQDFENMARKEFQRFRYMNFAKRMVKKVMGRR